jgi:hypothetical protein
LLRAGISSILKSQTKASTSAFFEMKSSISFISFAVLVTALPPVYSNGLEYHSLEARQANLPLLKLPYGTWQASKYEPGSDVSHASLSFLINSNRHNKVYTFKNIRFGAPATGQLRWAKPAPPALNTTLQTGDVGGTCYQSLPPAMLAVTLSGGLGGLGAPQGGGTGWFADFMSSLQSTLMPMLGSLLQTYPALATQIAGQVANQDLGKLMGGASSSEDCLFLDVFVPGSALKGQKKLPVVNWIYGGIVLHSPILLCSFSSWSTHFSSSRCFHSRL